MNEQTLAGLVMQALGMGQPLDAIMKTISQKGGKYAKAAEIIQGKNAEQLQTIAQNMAKENGINIDDIISSLGLKR